MSHKRKSALSPATNQALTIYNQGFAIVQETRNIRLTTGANEIQLEGIPLQYTPNSLKILSHTGSDELTIEGISYQAPTLNSAQVLARLEGHAVDLKLRTNHGRERWVSGTLLHYLNDKILLTKAAGKTSLINTADIVEFDFDGSVVIDGLTKTPCLVLSADATTAGACAVRVLYQTRGLSWQALHCATYDEKAGKLTDFEAWASIDNRSGAAFAKSRLTLLAGDVAMANDGGYEMVAMAAAAPMGGGSPKRARMRQAQSESVGEQKAYLVPGEFSIGEATSKQVPLFAAADVPVARDLFVSALDLRRQQEGGLTAVSIRLRLTNDADNKLGTPLPAGSVSIYQLDSRGDAQLTGTASIDHVAAGETFGFVIGTSTDIKAECRLVESKEGGGETAPPPDGSIKRPLGGPDVGRPGHRPEIVLTPAGDGDEEHAPKYTDETYEVTVHNFKTDAAVEVSVIEDLPGKHEILDSSHEFRKERSNRYSATVKIPAGDKATLRYSVRLWQE